MNRRGRFVSGISVVAISVGLMTGVSGPAHAADAWGSTTPLSAPLQAASATQIAVSTDGSKATAVWLRSNGSYNIVQTASATISGSKATWSTVKDLSTTGRAAYTPQVALSSDGTVAIAMWSRDSAIQTASASISGNTATWSDTSSLTSNTSYSSTPQVSISGDGSKAIAVWSTSDGTNNRIQAQTATLDDGSASWGTPTWVSEAGRNASSPQIAASTDATQATAVWYRNDGSNNITQSASATVSENVSTWGASTDLGAAGSPSDLQQIAVSSDGDKAVAIWRRKNGSTYYIQSNWASISGTDASWSDTTTDLTPTDATASSPGIAMSSDGTKATAVFYRSIESRNIIHSVSATLTDTGITWGTATALSALGAHAASPQLALASDGTKAVATWYRGQLVQVASATILGNAATWSASTDLTPTGTNVVDPQIATSTDGTRTSLIWTRSDGSKQIANSVSGMNFVPGAPTVEQTGDTLTIAPPEDTGGSPITEYQILYNTQTRIDANKAWATWATWWPAGSVSINLATYQTAGACTVVAATATPFAGKCYRAIGEHVAGTTFSYQVGAVNANGRSAWATVNAARPEPKSNLPVTQAGLGTDPVDDLQADTSWDSLRQFHPMTGMATRA